MIPIWFFAAALAAFGQEIAIWPGVAPGSEGITEKEEAMPKTDAFTRITKIHRPTLTPYLAQKGKATGAAFVICPGGAHRYVVVDLEGEFVAKKLNAMGIAGFVLKSRLSKAAGSKYQVDVESLADAQQAIRVLRTRAAEWGLDPKKIGIMGFSAGGELAALASIRFDKDTRPDVAVLGYPAVRNPEWKPLATTPATFIVVANDDSLAPNSAEWYLKLKAAKVPAELHIYAKGGHGFGMTGRTPAFAASPLAGWPEMLQAWLKEVGFL